MKIARERNIPSLALTITTRDDHLEVEYHNRHVQKQNIYGIGSATKFLSSVLVFKLIEEQKLALDDRIVQYVSLNEHISGTETVTVRNLLNHTGGLSDYTKDPQWIENVMNDEPPKTFEKKLSMVDQVLIKKDTFSYSNTHYLILEKIVESITGKPFNKAFNDFYEELGLSGIELRTTAPGLQAFFAQTDKASSDVSHWEEHYGFDAGVYSTPGELSRFLKLLFTDRSVLDQNTLSQMKEWIPMQQMSIPVGAGIISAYGNGIMKLSYNGKVYIGHSGGTLKYQSFVFFNEDDDIAVSITTNCSGRYYNNIFFQELIPAILGEL